MRASWGFVIVAWLSIGLQGCGWILQSTVTGWTHEEVRVRKAKETVEIRPVPAAAKVYRLDDGTERLISNGFAKDLVEYEIAETYRVNNSMTWLFLGGFMDLALLVGGIIAVATADIGTAPKAISLTFGSMIGIALPITEWTFSGVFAFEEPEQLKTEVRPTTQQYLAREDGYRDLVVQATVPGTSEMKLTLVVLPPAALVVKPPPPKDHKIVAVMEVVDLNASDAARAVEPLLLRNIGDQLRVFVASGGFRTVERGSQESVLAEQIQELKAATYKSCYDERCQIELGKALAAQFILRSQVTRFGASCVLNGELIDLASEVVVAAGSSRGDCVPEGFYKMTEELADKIIAKGR